MSTGTLRTLVVDDEALARERLTTLLAAHLDVCVIGECASGEEAVDAIAAESPDLVFLDVQMPGGNGFDVVAGMGPERAPAVIFATAYDEFALRAFDANAVDYLLKPIGEERLAEALQRVRRRLGAGVAPAVNPGLLALLQQLGEAPAYRTRFAVRAGERFHVVRAADITWIEAADNYVRLHVSGGSHLLRATVREMEGMLDPRRFLRISRSAIVNVDRIREIQPWFRGDYVVILQNGAEVTSTRGYRDVLKALLAGESI